MATPTFFEQKASQPSVVIQPICMPATEAQLNQLRPFDVFFMKAKQPAAYLRNLLEGKHSPTRNRSKNISLEIRHKMGVTIGKTKLADCRALAISPLVTYGILKM